MFEHDISFTKKLFSMHWFVNIFINKQTAAPSWPLHNSKTAVLPSSTTTRNIQPWTKHNLWRLSFPFPLIHKQKQQTARPTGCRSNVLHRMSPTTRLAIWPHVFSGYSHFLRTNSEAVLQTGTLKIP